ncbi:MAG: tripartite tricarboxylate transporter substrate binding protein [Deinococcales bacterium]
MTRLRYLLLSIICLLGFALAQYPERPVEFVVPWPPGDLEDILTRLIAEEMQQETGVPAAVVNMPGGGGLVGAIDVFQKPADGHSVGSFVIGIPTVQVMNGNAPYARDDFEAVGIFLTYPFVIATRADAPYSNLAELAAYSQDHELSLGHFGYGLVPTRATLLSLEDLGGKYASEAAFDVLDCSSLASGDADVINTTIQLILPCLDEVKILASISQERLSIAPDVPTLSEQVEGWENIFLWNGLFVKKGTPQEVKDLLSTVAQRAINSDAAQDLAETTGAAVYWMDASASQELIDQNWEQLEAILKRMGDL